MIHIETIWTNEIFSPKKIVAVRMVIGLIPFKKAAESGAPISLIDFCCKRYPNPEQNTPKYIIDKIPLQLTLTYIALPPAMNRLGRVVKKEIDIIQKTVMSTGVFLTCLLKIV